MTHLHELFDPHPLRRAKLSLQMSHRLKLNAIHFASSLEGEKALLESSQDALESASTVHLADQSGPS